MVIRQNTNRTKVPNLNLNKMVGTFVFKISTVGAYRIRQGKGYTTSIRALRIRETNLKIKKPAFSRGSKAMRKTQLFMPLENQIGG